MKKRLLSLLMALCLMLTLAPAAFAADTSGLQTLIDNAAAGSTIDLTSDYTLTEPITINKAITINGGNHTITYNGSGAAIEVTATNAVSLENLIVNATASGGRGIAVNTQQMNLTLTGCTLNVHSRGINIYADDPTNTQDGLDVTGSLTLDNTKILNSQVSNYATNTTVGDTRGISVYRVQGGEITIENNSEIKGFGYSINSVAAADSTGFRNGEGTVYNITNSTIIGWSALNIWSANTEYNFKNCTLVGINTLSGSWNGFSTIRVNDNIYGGHTDKASVITFKGGSVTAKQFGTALESAFTVDKELQTQFVFEKNGFTKVSIRCYAPDGDAKMFCFYPGTNGDAYLVSEKVKGLTSNTTQIYGDIENVSSVGDIASQFDAGVAAVEENPGIVTVEQACNEGGNIG